MSQHLFFFFLGVITQVCTSQLLPVDTEGEIYLQDDLLNVQDQRMMDIEQRILKLRNRLGKRIDLEIRVSVLEESMADVESDLDDVEYVNLLQDQRINLIETNVLTNEQDIEDLSDSTNELQSQVSSLQFDVSVLDQRVENLESNGGGPGNNTDLIEAVEHLEEVTSVLSDVIVDHNSRISGVESNITSVDLRLDAIESEWGPLPDYRSTVFEAAMDKTENDAPPSNTVFEWELINPGGHYDNYNGYYTAPYDGYYLIHAQFQTYEFDGESYISVQRDADTAGSHNDAATHEQYRAVSVLLPASQGTFIGITRYRGAYGSPDELNSYAFGYLVAKY